MITLLKPCTLIIKANGMPTFFKIKYGTVKKKKAVKTSYYGHFRYGIIKNGKNLAFLYLCLYI